MIVIYEETEDTRYVLVDDEHVDAFRRVIARLKEGERYPDRIVGVTQSIAWDSQYGAGEQYQRETVDYEFLRNIYSHDFKRGGAANESTRRVTLDMIEDPAYRAYIAEKWAAEDSV